MENNNSTESQLRTSNTLVLRGSEVEDRIAKGGSLKKVDKT